MDNEVSQSLTIFIHMMVVSVIVGIIALITLLSQNFGRDSVATVADIQAQTYATELVSMGSYGSAVPAASVYITLKKNRDAIHSISGSAYGEILRNVDDLAKLFDKRITLIVTPIDPNKMDSFNLVVKEEYPNE